MLLQAAGYMAGQKTYPSHLVPLSFGLFGAISKAVWSDDGMR